MRFFTMAWWRGEQGGSDTDALFEAYRAHVATLRQQLPADRVPVLDALETVAAHDGKLRNLRLDVAAATLLLELDAYWPGGRLALAYAGVRSVNSAADPGGGFADNNAFGDLGYWEVDRSSDGLSLVHRLLFSVGMELEVVFDGPFEFRREGTPEPGAA